MIANTENRAKRKAKKKRKEKKWKKKINARKRRERVEFVLKKHFCFER